MSLKPMNASAYRAHSQTKKNERPTEVIELKSGSVFELRRPLLQNWVMTGRVPQSLLEQGLKAWREQGKTPDGMGSSMQPQMVTDTAIFMLAVVQECTVNPRLVQFPDPDKNEIGPETMLEEDFYEIFSWAMNGQGVAGVDALRSFREGRERGVASDSHDGAGLPSETVETPAN